jgi:hypothetical protein
MIKREKIQNFAKNGAKTSTTASVLSLVGIFFLVMHIIIILVAIFDR